MQFHPDTESEAQAFNQDATQSCVRRQKSYRRVKTIDSLNIIREELGARVETRLVSV